MIEDCTALLSRHFSQGEIGEVLQLVHQLFERRWAEQGSGNTTGEVNRTSGTPTARSTQGKKHLH
jgi:hypothetical protein